MLRIATSPIEGRPWHSAKLRLFARGSPTRGAGAQRLRGCTKDSLTVSRSGENLSVIACAMPPPLSRGGFGIPQGFISSPEAPLLGELASDSETERLYEGQHDREPQWRKPLRHRLRDATSPIEGRPWHSAKLRLFARGSPTRGAGAQRLRGCTKEHLPSVHLVCVRSTTYDENMNKNSKKPYRSRFRSAIIFYACYKNLK